MAVQVPYSTVIGGAEGLAQQTTTKAETKGAKFAGTIAASVSAAL